MCCCFWAIYWNGSGGMNLITNISIWLFSLVANMVRFYLYASVRVIFELVDTHINPIFVSMKNWQMYYRIAGNIGEELNRQNWRRSWNENPPIIFCVIITPYTASRNFGGWSVPYLGDCYAHSRTSLVAASMAMFRCFKGEPQHALLTSVQRISEACNGGGRNDEERAREARESEDIQISAENSTTCS